MKSRKQILIWSLALIVVVVINAVISLQVNIYGKTKNKAEVQEKNSMDLIKNNNSNVSALYLEYFDRYVDRLGEWAYCQEKNMEVNKGEEHEFYSDSFFDYAKITDTEGDYITTSYLDGNLNTVTYTSGNIEASANLESGHVSYSIYDPDFRESINIGSLPDLKKKLFLAERVQSDNCLEEDIFVNINAEKDTIYTKFIIDTNLPEGTQLAIFINDGDIYAPFVYVENGKALLKTYEIGSGTYTFEVYMVAPNVQNDFVKTIVGVNGQYLQGDLVVNSMGGKTIQKIQKFNF